MGFGSFIKKFAGPVSDLVGAAAGAAQVGQSFAAGNNYDDQAIQRRVMDAKAAGIHPLYALGSPATIPGPTGGSGISEGLSTISRAAGRSAQRTATATARTAQAPLDAAALAHTEAQTDYIRWQIEQQKLAMMSQRVNQTGYMRGAVTSEMLPQGYMKDPSGRLSMFRDARGKWNRVDTTLAPSEVLEEEYGETGGELQGAARAVKGAYGYKGWSSDYPSLREIIDYISNR